MERLSPMQPAAQPPVQPDGDGQDDEPGGDPVCWLSLVCPECGRVPEGPGEVCERCGTPRR